MVFVLGFVIALAIGVTGVGGGTITVPVLMLFLHLAPDKTVGTALAFAAAVKLLVVPVYVARGQVSYRVLGLTLAGGLPGLLAGLYILHRLHATNQNALLTILIGVVIIATSLMNIFRSNRRVAVQYRSQWLPWVMLPIGAEVGFSSAGAGAIGSLALLNLTRLTPAQVIGTDVAFGLVLSLLGGSMQIATGGYDPALLVRLVAGGVFGALIGPNLAAWLPSKSLRVALCVSLASLGTMICWRAAM